MNAKLKAKWLKALRGGAYRQTDSQLTNAEGDAFCCLGVLANIQGCEWLPSSNGEGMVPISPRGRKTWCADADDWLPSSRAGGLSEKVQESLARMNDEGQPFSKIADYIEENL